jgi:hypothetical protein
MASSPTRIQGKHVIHDQYPSVLTGSAVSGFKVGHGDTVFIIGDPEVGSATEGTGQFQLDAAPSVPDEEGWTGIDLTAKTVSKWHIDPFNAETLDGVGNNALWAGELFAEGCSPSDVPEGYANGYNEFIDYWSTVTNPGAGTAISVSLILNYDNEPGYDYLDLNYETSSGWVNAAFWNGTNYDVGLGVFVPVSDVVLINYALLTYVGPGNDQIHLRFNATSDGGWSDSDCYWPTAGHSQIDNISVSGDNGVAADYEDFESGLAGSDWKIAFPTGVGDFSKVWPSLGSLDPCTINTSPQFAFIDDGEVELCGGAGGLGTLGAAGHQYGVLDGWAVNLLGGCAGETEHLNNEIWSPELAWPTGDYVGAEYSFAAYPDLPLGNGLFYVWHVNSKDITDNWTGWQDRNFVYYGDATYARRFFDVTDLIVQSPTGLRLALGAYELGYVWGFVGTNATPGPYFDEVAFKVFPSNGPQITTRELEMAQDSFPTSGSISFGADLDIRFDMANDIGGAQNPAIDPGDSITFTITAVRPGSSIETLPLMYWTMKQNADFNAFRTNTEFGAATSGVVTGAEVMNGTTVIPDKYWFDLPDDDFFFPGDVIHYYIYAEDVVGTDPPVGGTLPGNLLGYGVFDDIQNPDQYYDSSFTVHGLPTLSLNVTEDGYDQPSMIFWNDFANRGGENEWYFALSQLGFQRHENYDIYYTNAPSSGVSNGLGGRATATQLAGYSTMLYHAGNLRSFTFADYDQTSEKSNDILLMDTWLLQGGKNLFMTGDEIIEDLSDTVGGTGTAFINSWIGVNYGDADVGDVIGYQTAPVVASAHATELDLPRDFIAFGSCPSINSFNQFTLQTGTVALANYVGGTSTYPAVTYKYNAGVNSTVVFAGVDFSYWYTIGSSPSSRQENLSAILTSFGESSSKGIATGAPAAKPFFARNYPNPFNPITKIEFSVPKAGDVSVKIYNVRGELVRTLVDEHMDASDLVVREWNGTDTHGAAVASGVYFYETRTNGNVKVNKMALVK